MKAFKFFSGLLALTLAVGLACKWLDTGVPIALLMGGVAGFAYSLKFDKDLL